MDGKNLGILNKATISYSYLHTNSTTHENLLGAIAELVDNSRDAKADNLYIDYDSNSECMTVLDDGCGMTQKETANVLSFGFSHKRNRAGMIGQYGNGLKSGAMRIALDMIVLTKKEGQLSCLLLSRTFHKEHNLHEVFVPNPCFNAEDRHMMCTTKNDIDKHRLEMEIIYKYSPFSDQNSLFTQFERIKGDSGTLIVLYNLRRLLTGDLELDFKTSEDDIRLTDHVNQREEEYNSLRAYLSVLYLNPRMKIHLRGRKVQTTRITSTLIMKYEYQYLGKNLKACATKEHDKCRSAVRDAEERLRVAQSDFGCYSSVEHSQVDKNERLQRRVLSGAVEEAKLALKEAKDREMVAKKAISNPTPLKVVFGLNVHHRNRYGCMFYNNGRMILAYQKTATQKEKNDFMMECLGVVGIVDVPYSVLAPTHNKQSFENQREFLLVMRAMTELMSKYWIDIAIGGSPSLIKHFWKPFGYNKTEWNSEPMADVECKKNRYNKTEHWIQCDNCLKWRRVPAQMKYISYGIPDDWKCADHPNAMHRKCSEAQETERIKSGANKTEKQVEMVTRPVKVEVQSSTSDPEPEPEKDRNGKRKASEVTATRPLAPVVNKNDRGENSKDKRSTKSRRYQDEDDDEEEEEESDEEEEEEDDVPAKKRGRPNLPERVEKAPYVLAPPARKCTLNTPNVEPKPMSNGVSSSASSSSSSKRMIGQAPMTKTRKPSVVVSSDDEMPESRPARKAVPPAAAAQPKRPVPVLTKKVPNVVQRIPAVPPTKNTRKPGSVVLPVSPVPIREVREDTSIYSNGVKNNSGGSSAKKADGLDDQERRELTKLREERKSYAAVTRELLKQLAKKGCNEADRLLRMTDERIRDIIEPEKMINTFWEEKVRKPIVTAQQRSLAALEKGGAMKIVEKEVEVVKEVVKEIEVVPEKYRKMEESSIGITKWLMPHYHQNMDLAPDYDINHQTVFEVMEKMCAIVNSAATEGDA